MKDWPPVYNLTISLVLPLSCFALYFQFGPANNYTRFATGWFLSPKKYRGARSGSVSDTKIIAMLANEEKKGKKEKKEEKRRGL